MGPHVNKLSKNRFHGASYDPNKNFTSLDADSISLKKDGAIQLFYLTVTGYNLKPQTLRMRDIYRYIIDISAEYTRATGTPSSLLPFDVIVEKQGDKKRIAASYIGIPGIFPRVKIGTLQGFRGLRRENNKSTKLVSKWYHKGDVSSMRLHVQPVMFYNRCESNLGRVSEYSLVPLSQGNLLLPEELPILLAFYHMSNVARYNPEGLQSLMDSNYWPLLLVLRRHGLYAFLLSFWSFMNQSCTHIIP